MTRLANITVIALLFAGSAAGQAPATLGRADSLRLSGELAAADSAYATLVNGSTGARRSALAARAELAEQTGRRELSRQWATSLTVEYEQTAGRGWGARDQLALGRAWQLLSGGRPDAVRQALAAFDAAAALDSASSDAPLSAAELLLEKFNAPDARSGFEAVLRRFPSSARAQLGLARVLVFEGKAEAFDATRRALLLDSTLAPGELLLGRLHLEAEQYDSASALARSALRHDAGAVGGWALLGAVAWLRGDTAGFRSAEASALQVNPRSAEFLAEVAEAAARHRRYVDAVTLAERAVAFDSASTRALAVLATNQLRLGQMESGRKTAERAFTLDPFNLWQKNSLDLLDAMQKFVTIESAKFRVVAPAQDVAYLRLYLLPLLETAYDSLARRYQYRPPTPVRVEVFRRHADFSVRTVGLTGLGALGVSFGGVLVMDGPGARAPGEFNFGSTAWHELTHTFTLGLSENRVPRWLSEGMSVLEERRTGRGWGQDVSAAFLATFKAGRLRPVGEINEGLVRPRHPEEIGDSYLEASLVCEMIEAQYGVEALRALLRAFRDGRDETAAFDKVLKLSVSALDQKFTAWMQVKYAVPLAALDPWDGSAPLSGAFVTALAQGQRALEAGQLEIARAELERAKQLFPGYASPDAPAYALARMDSTRPMVAATQLAIVTAHNETALSANSLEARFRMRGGDVRGAAAALERLVWIDPLNIEAHARLAEAAEQLADWPLLVRERRAILALGAPDQAEARYQLARALARAGDISAARREVLQLLEQAPGFEKAQELLLELRAATPAGGAR